MPGRKTLTRTSAVRRQVGLATSTHLLGRFDVQFMDRPNPISKKLFCDMFSDITTPENRIKAKKDYQKHLCDVLKAAICIYDQLHEDDRGEALRAVNHINRIRYRIYEKAMRFGYVTKCRDAIGVCKGDCCKWHFPKNLSYPDLFIIVCSISAEKQKALKGQIVFDNGKYQCPILRENGCSLSFDSRPLVCSNAYPCFAGGAFYDFLSKQRKEIDVHYILLKEIFERYLKKTTNSNIWHLRQHVTLEEKNGKAKRQ